jgi:hypothetical protein
LVAIASKCRPSLTGIWLQFLIGRRGDSAIIISRF